MRSTPAGQQPLTGIASRPNRLQCLTILFKEFTGPRRQPLRSAKGPRCTPVPASPVEHGSLHQPREAEQAGTGDGIAEQIVACPLRRTKALPSMAIAECTAEPLALSSAAFVGLQRSILPHLAPAALPGQQLPAAPTTRYNSARDTLPDFPRHVVR